MRPSTARCAYGRRNHERSGDAQPLVNSQRACQQFEQASRAALAPANRPTQRPRPRPEQRPAQPAPPPSRPTSPTYRVQVNECRQHVAGSIRYRECRADEAKRLRRECIRWRNHADHPATVGRELAKARGWARSFCFEAGRYRIVE